MREEILRTIQLWQRVRAGPARSLRTRRRSTSRTIAAAIAAQAAGLSLADAAKRVAAVDEVRELMEHNIRAEAALPRLARALATPAPGLSAAVGRRTASAKADGEVLHWGKKCCLYINKYGRQKGHVGEPCAARRWASSCRGCGILLLLALASYDPRTPPIGRPARHRR
jgi:hypothetical protein